MKDGRIELALWLVVLVLSSFILGMVVRNMLSGGC